MSKYWNTEIYSQLSAEELRKKASESVKNASKKGKKLKPIIVRSQKICTTWWGKAWCENLEQYADYASRIDRGKRYIRSGAVIDLQINRGTIDARVQGNRKIPYQIKIAISPMKEEQCQWIMQKCSNKIENLQMLATGNFPEELKDLFIGELGLFPIPQEISFQCSCPDWALMCKHVAAALYGVGVILDENPFMLFELRGIEVERFIDIAVENKVEKMLQNIGEKTDRMIDEAAISDIFGVISK